MLTNAFRKSCLAAMLVTGVSCGGPQSGDMQDQSVEEALGAGKCGEVKGKSARPYVVEMTASDRSLLQVKFKEQGIVMVSFDCKTLTILDRCRADGDYGYVGVDPEIDQVRLATVEDVGINIGGGAALAGKLQAELKQGRTLDIAIMTVGMRSTAVSSLTSEQLTGEDCSSATHYVRRADVGGFAMDMGSSKEANAALEVFNSGAHAGTKSDKSLKRSSGSASECKKARGDDTAPPSGCGGVVQLALLPIGGGAKPKSAGELDARDCPEGFVFAENRCTRAGDKLPNHLCARADEADCKKQCEAGNDGSCGRLAALAVTANKGRAGTLAAALDERFRKACDAGEGDACFYLGDIAFEAAKKDAARQAAAVELLEKAVIAGHPVGGSHLQVLLGPLGEQFKWKPDHQRLARTLKRGCDAGNAEACADIVTILGSSSMAGAFEGVLGKNQQQTYAKRACVSGSGHGCYVLGVLHLGKSALCTKLNPNGYFCTATTKDLAAAKASFKRSCELTFTLGCAVDKSSAAVDKCDAGDKPGCKEIELLVRQAALEAIEKGQ